jgi:hypothetical protein
MITLCEVQLVRGSFEGSAATRNLVHTTDSELCMLSTLHNEQDFSSYLVRNGIRWEYSCASTTLLWRYNRQQSKHSL